MLRRRCASLSAFCLVLILPGLQTHSGYSADASGNESRGAPELTFEQELQSHDQNDDSAPRKNADLVVLGFVTPWNAKGKDVAISQASRGRLDASSPVTWQMHPGGLAGGQDFDDAFYKDLSQAGSRIYPRVLFERWTVDDFRKLSEDPQPMVARIVQMCQAGGFEGVVLEIWQSMLGVGALRGKQKGTYIELIRALGEGVRKDTGLHTVLVLPPYTGPEAGEGVGAKDLEKLKIAFSHFVVMTYDFSSPGSRPGPMAPIEWVETVGSYLAKGCGLGRKVLIGLNFYGLDFLQRSDEQAARDRHVVGHEYISLLKEHKADIVWMEQFGEHVFGYVGDDGQHMVFYPTRQSIALRIALVNKLGCGGVAIWELGQGLNHFFEEF